MFAWRLSFEEDREHVPILMSYLIEQEQTDRTCRRRSLQLVIVGMIVEVVEPSGRELNLYAGDDMHVTRLPI